MKFKTLLIKSPAVQLAVYDELVNRGMNKSNVVRDRLAKGDYLSVEENSIFLYTPAESSSITNEYHQIVTVEEMLAIRPEAITVPLNNDYDAIVTKNSIKVGCQTFSPSILEKLVEAHKIVSDLNTNKTNKHPFERPVIPV